MDRDAWRMLVQEAKVHKCLSFGRKTYLVEIPAARWLLSVCSNLRHTIEENARKMPIAFSYVTLNL
jgi:hypothetical protein